MRDAAGTAKRKRAEAGAYRPLAHMLGLCAVIAPSFFMAGCSVSSKVVDPSLAAATSPQTAERGEPAAEAGEAGKAGTPYAVAGRSYVPGDNPTNYSAEGLASWYGPTFHGRTTANGEVFDVGSITAAHPTLPLPSYARVTNVNNGKSMIVRVNDRGPFHADRAIDVSERVAEVLDFKRKGMARVRIDYVGPAALEGSDDAKLMATYRENGRGPETAVAALDAQSDIAGLYRDPVQSRLAAAHQIPQGPLRGTSPTPAPQLASIPQTAAPAPQAAAPQASAPQAPVTAQAQTTATTPSAIASRIDAGFSGMASPQPLTQSKNGTMVQPVLSGFAFDPTAFGSVR